MTIEHRIAIIDIGSNSVRLVVYGGPARAPVSLYNEKVMAGLGRSLAKDGTLAKDAVEEALLALGRFYHLIGLMAVPKVRVVATAAVRDAKNAAEFLRRVRDIGIDVEILSGDEEAVAAGMGVISGWPNADGVVGDLGGGSLELVRVKAGRVRERISLPLGVLRLAALRGGGDAAFERDVGKMLAPHTWLRDVQGLPFYMVGGSWRSLARLHIHRTGYGMPVLSNYTMPPGAAEQLVSMTAKLDKAAIKEIPTLSSARLPMLDGSAVMLALIVKLLKPDSLITCAYGLREGLLFGGLSAEERQLDPLIVGARFEGERQGRFGAHGDDLFRWLSPVFADEGKSFARLRHAACLLSDIAWSANPEFRAERGLEAALHGTWIGVSARDRALIAMAVFTSLGGGAVPANILGPFASEKDLAIARVWGLAIRLGQRLGGGTETALRRSRLAIKDQCLVLTFDADHADLGGESVSRRLKQLASAMGYTMAVAVSQS
jgi:exopolyphosphatase / guanosine-5'-triphosphate,3'-diphosphate pyrophosphatase